MQLGEGALILLRHATARPAAAGESDFDRPLTARGQAEAQGVGDFLAQNGFKPDAVVCSAAVRTESTARALIRRLTASSPQLIADRELYETTAGAFLARVQALAPLRRVIAVGHNPTLEALGSWLAGQALNLQPGSLIWFDADLSQPLSSPLKIRLTRDP